MQVCGQCGHRLGNIGGRQRGRVGPLPAELQSEQGIIIEILAQATHFNIRITFNQLLLAHFMKKIFIFMEYVIKLNDAIDLLEVVQIYVAIHFFE